MVIKMNVHIHLVLVCCCLLASAWAQGYFPTSGVNEVSGFNNQFRRQLSTQQHILTDVQHHTQKNDKQFGQQQQQHQSHFLPQNGDQGNHQVQRFPHLGASRNVLAPSANNYQPNTQFQRSAQNPVFSPPQQQSNLDLHTQNFLTLRNYANQQVGSQQNLPQRSYSNKPFQGQSQSQPQQYSGYQKQPQQIQPQQNLINGSPTVQQTQQKLPNLLPVPTFQTHTAPQRPFSTLPQFTYAQQQHQQQQQKQQQTAQYQQHLQQQAAPLQQQQAYQLTPNLGIPVPQIFPRAQSPTYSQQPSEQSAQSSSRPQQIQQSQQQQFITQQLSNFPAAQSQAVDQEYKQKLIQKHEQFVQKQYEKSQTKVKQLHEDFLSKQQTLKQQVLPTIVGTQQSYQQPNYAPPRGRPVDTSELQLFSSALQKYQEEHPTTTTTTTTEATSDTNGNNYSQLKADLGKYGTKTAKKPVNTIGRDELLKQLKAALAEAPQQSLGNKTYEEMDLVLPNGQHVQVIRTTDPNLVKGQQGFSSENLQTFLNRQTDDDNQAGLTNIAPETRSDLALPNGSKVQILRSPAPKEITDIDPESLPGINLSNFAALYGGDITGISNSANNIASSAVIQSDSDEPPTLEELAKRGLIPDGYEIEGLSSSKTKSAASTAPPKKKATYVYLEEQADGSFKIQGVKANGEKETKKSGSEVESILERIRNGDIKLPPSVHRLTLPNDEVVEIRNGKVIQEPKSSITTTESTTTTTTFSPFSKTSSQRQSPSSRISGRYVEASSSTISPLPHQSGLSHFHDTSTYRTTVSPIYANLPSTSTSYGSSTHTPVTKKSADTSLDASHFADTLVQESENTENQFPPNPSHHSDSLINILKSNGLFAMAKYLRQSGLDSILNETGPYTIFVPTDKAFKNLLVQLGGPERAEEKFKSNPRLLSGLLLHHVIPGSFEIAALQDEMTGVSLAGTQLRVNQYTMHDQEWNDVTLTTINGAMVILNKKDIKIPQGIAHAVDRVMFPLPVGDLLQTLQSDRENRFSKFLKILYTSGLSEKLQSKGIKTYTVFAPTDKSFNDIESDLLEKLLTDKEAAEEFAMKHIVVGSLFSAGMRFYQVKDSLLTGKTVILQKTSGGKIKVNDAQMITSNIPATNGVIHALDGVLA